MDSLAAHDASVDGRRHIGALIVLTLAGSVNYLDRQIMGILLPQIKLAFHLSDTALGLLAGPAFAVTYGVVGVPLALLADRGNRRTVIAASLGVFSLMTALCGMAGSFVALLCARLGTGVGEAGTGPAINALLSDLFPPSRRAGALSIYAAGANLGFMVAFFGGGWVAEHHGWRLAFLAASIPGWAILIVLLATIREPLQALRRTQAPPPFRATVRVLLARRSFRYIAAGMALASVASYAGLAFTPSFLMRSHHMTPAAIGLTLALLLGIAGMVGTALAGVVTDRFGRGDARWSMTVAAVGTAAGLPLLPVFYLANDLTVALAAVVVPVLLGAAYLGPSYAAVQGLAPVRMRAQAAALLLLIANLVGPSIGPQMTGILSDLLQPRFGADALRYALLVSILPGVAAAWCFWEARRTIMSDMTGIAPATS